MYVYIHVYMHLCTHWHTLTHTLFKGSQTRMHTAHIFGAIILEMKKRPFQSIPMFYTFKHPFFHIIADLYQLSQTYNNHHRRRCCLPLLFLGTLRIGSRRAFPRWYSGLVIRTNTETAAWAIHVRVRSIIIIIIVDRLMCTAFLWLLLFNAISLMLHLLCSRLHHAFCCCNSVRRLRMQCIRGRQNRNSRQWRKKWMACGRRWARWRDILLLYPCHCSFRSFYAGIDVVIVTRPSHDLQ